MPVLRLFAAAREAAGVARVDIDGSTVADILEVARARYGDRFVAVLERSRIWVNGQPAAGETPVQGRDVVAVIPPVSGGADDRAVPAATRGGSAGAVLDHPRSPPPSTRPSPGVPRPERPVRAGEPRPERPVRAGEPRPERPVRAGEPGPPAGARVGTSRPLDVQPRDFDLARRDPGTGNGNGGRSTAPPAAYSPRPVPPPPPPPGRPGAVPAALRRPSGPPVSTGPSRPPPAAPAPARETRPPSGPSERDKLVRSGRAEPENQVKAALESVKPTASRLAVGFATTRPHGRLGLLWFMLLVPAALVGSEPLAALLAITAAVGACQAVASRRARGEHPQLPTAAVGALAIPVAAVGGLQVAAIAAGAAAGLILIVWVVYPRRTTPGDVVITIAITVAVGVAAASPVLLRDFRLDLALLLLGFASAYDAGAYLVGTGASYAWEGPAAGMVALMPITIFSAVILVPPLSGGGPFLLGLLAAALAPLGPLVGTALIGTSDADVPGLRRLDSLLVLGPGWAAIAAVMV